MTRNPALLLLMFLCGDTAARRECKERVRLFDSPETRRAVIIKYMRELRIKPLACLRFERKPAYNTGIA